MLATARLLLAAGAASFAYADYTPPNHWIIISQPGQRQVRYQKLLTFEEQVLPLAQRPKRSPKVLIEGEATTCSGKKGSLCSGSTKGLQAPEGLALYTGKDHARTLYVSDGPAAGASSTMSSIYAYGITVSDTDLSAGSPRTVLENIVGGAKWLALDSLGNLFYTSTGDEDNQGRIMKVDVAGLAPGGKAVAKVLWGPETKSESFISLPGGIASDGFHVFWANTDSGKTAGSVVRAGEIRGQGELTNKAPKAIAKASDSAYGVCMAKDNLFFTDASQVLYGVKKSGSASAMALSNDFKSPRGCAYDSEGSLYVADAALNAVYSLPGNMPSLRKVQHLTKVVDIQAPAQVAVFIANGAARHTALLAALAVAVALWGPHAG